MAEREKSPLYPGVTWGDSLEFAKVVDSFGLKAVSSSEVAKKLGLKSTNTKSFTTKVSAAKQFGLLASQGAGILQITDTCRRFFFPTGEDLRSVKLACFAMPSLYNKLIAVYDGKALPNAESLANILLSNYRITRAAKDTAAKCFIESAEQLKLIKGGILCYEESISTPVRDEPAAADKLNEKDTGKTSGIGESEDSVVQQYMTQSSESEHIVQSLPMSSGKVAKLIIPSDADRDGLLLLRDMFNAILLRRFDIGKDE